MCTNQWKLLRLHKRKTSRLQLKRRKSKKNSLLHRNNKLKDTHLDMLTISLKHLDLNHQFCMNFLRKLEMNCLQA